MSKNIRDVIVTGISLVSSAFTPAVPHATKHHAIFKIRRAVSDNQRERLEKTIQALEKLQTEKS